MPTHATTLSDAYAARLRTFERARRKLERPPTGGQVTRHDVSLFYEGILLRTVTGFEGLMEDLFVGLLAGGITPGATYTHALPSTLTPSRARSC